MNQAPLRPCAYLKQFLPHHAPRNCCCRRPPCITDFIVGMLNRIAYESEAPTSVGARHTACSVRILCTLFVTGFTHAASLVSSVVKPGCMVSKIFFFGFICASGVPSVEKVRSVSHRSSVRRTVEIRTLELSALKVDAITRFRARRRLNELDARLLAVFRSCLSQCESVRNIAWETTIKTHAKDHRKALDSTHVRGFEVALRFVELAETKSDLCVLTTPTRYLSRICSIGM